MISRIALNITGIGGFKPYYALQSNNFRSHTAMKKNVAGQVIGVQMITSSDGTAFTGTVTAYVTGDGGAQEIGSVGSGICAHEGNGFHTYTPSQAETNYDHIGYTFIGTGAIASTLQVYTQFPQSVDNATDITAILADTNELQGNQGDWATATGFSTFNPAIDTVANVTLVGTTTVNTDMRGTDSAILASSAPTNFSDLSITVTTGQITVGTNNDKTGYSISGTKTTLDALNDVSTAQVNAECDTALTDYDASTNAEMIAAFTEIKGATFTGSTDSLEAIRDRGDAAWLTGAGGSSPTADEIADAVWDETIVTHVAAGSFGAKNQNLVPSEVLGDYKADISTLATSAALAVVDGNVDLILIDTATTIPNQISGLNDISATDIVSNGAITTLAGAVVNVDTVDVTTLNTDMRGTDSANTIAPDNASIAAILIDTADLQANQGSWLTATGFATSAALSIVDSNVDAILIDTSTTIPAEIAALNDPSATVVADAVLAGIIEGTITLKQSIQLSNASLAGKLSGGATSTIAIRDLADTKDRISATVDADGNRAAVTRDFD